MRIAQINMTPFGSTGRIMLQIAKTAQKAGMTARAYTTEFFTINGRSPRVKEENLYYYGSFYENMVHNYLGKLLGRNGQFSYFGTKQLIRELKRFAPDIVHLHNLHCHCIHLPALFRYLKKSNVKVIWTLHDCWSFTGHCPHFDMYGCDKWKTGCHHCGQLKGYPKSYLDTSKQMYRKKQRWFTALQHMTLVTPSAWLAGLAKQSFLNKFPVKTIHNGIDLSIFKPTDSDFREKHGLQNKKILLGVSFGWSDKKGLDAFLELARRLSDEYRIVLVGTNEALDATLPSNVVSIHHTNNQQELAEIYSAADLFVNCTREDTFPTVNLEALACGTPIITFDTGGSPECVDATCGSVVKKNDVDAMEKEILRIFETQPFSKAACVMRAKCFDMQDKFNEYVDLYREVCKK